MGKKILAVVIGLVAGGLAIMGVESINVLLFPLPEGVTLEDKEAFAEYVQGLPASALITVLFAHIIGAFVAGFLSSKIASTNNQILAIICGLVLLTGAIANLFMIPHPVWFMVVNVLTIIPSAMLGGQLHIKK